MKCEIIRDLLPAYCDCVCSIETAAEIESHVDGCADCKKLLDDYRSDIKPTGGGAPEKPFRRISRKIFRNKLVIAALAILLAAVLGGVGYLTYGQFVREPDQPSFETIISSQKAKKLVKKFCEGDIDYVMENIELYQTGVALYESRDEVREYCRTVLSDFYEKYLKGRNLNVKTNGYSGYTDFSCSRTFCGWICILSQRDSIGNFNGICSQMAKASDKADYQQKKKSTYSAV